MAFLIRDDEPGLCIEPCPMDTCRFVCTRPPGHFPYEHFHRCSPRYDGADAHQWAWRVKGRLVRR